MAEHANTVPELAEWLGGDVDDWPSIDTADDGDAFTACYYLAGVESLRTRNDKPYLKLQLCDRNGVVDGRVWDDADAVAARLEAGTFVGVRGRVQIYKGSRQLKVEEISRVRVRPEEKDRFMPRSPRDQEVMERELDGVLESIRDPGLRTLLARLVGRESETGRRFRTAPAAMRNHHAYIGGLLEHTLSVVRLCEHLAAHYGELVDRDLLVAGALLHDIGKIEEIAAEAGFPYTDEGKLLGHILLGLRLVEDEARQVAELTEERRTLLLHLIASHQGKYEWQSPREPRILEGLLLHAADDLDAKMNQAMRRLEEADEAEWSGYDRSFGRDFLRHAVQYPAPEPAPPGRSGEGGGGAGGGTPARRRAAPAGGETNAGVDATLSLFEDE